MLYSNGLILSWPYFSIKLSFTIRPLQNAKKFTIEKLTDCNTYCSSNLENQAASVQTDQQRPALPYFGRS